MKSVFEYMFYTLARINYKGKNSERITFSLSITQSLIILNILIFLYGIIFGAFPKIPKLLAILVIMSMFYGLDYFNQKIYKRKYAEFHSRWQNENMLIRIFKVIGVFLLIALSWSLFVLNYWIFK